MRKWVYFSNNREDERRKPEVNVIRHERKTVGVRIVTPGLGAFAMSAELTPTEAREMAAGLLELADVVESEDHE